MPESNKMTHSFQPKKAPTAILSNYMSIVLFLLPLRH